MVKFVDTDEEVIKKNASSKHGQVNQISDRARDAMATLVYELESFTGWALTETMTPGGQIDSEDLVILIADFEKRRAEIQVHMDKLNAISAIAGAGTSPEQMVINATAFITETGYKHAIYSTQFNK